MIVTAIDLELNKENGQTTDIIQIGAVTGNIRTGLILEEVSCFIKIDKPLDPFIIELTGITDKKLQEEGVSLIEGYNKLKTMHQKRKAHKSLVQWGTGDEYCLKKQLLEHGMKLEDWEFGFRHWDVKTIAQFLHLKKGFAIKGGLKTYCERFNLPFEGTAHDALNDARMTFKLFNILLK